MKTLEEQLKALKAGDEIEFRNGTKEVLPATFNRMGARMRAFGIDWIVEGRGTGLIGTANGQTPFDIVRVIPKLEDGWIRWTGGECPLPSQSRVRVRHRDGEVIDRRLASFWRWEHIGMPGDIVAYQVLGSGSIRDRLAQLRASSESEDSTDCFARKSDFDRLLAILIDREAA